MLLPPVLAHLKSLGHAVFLNGDYNLNLFGIRSPDDESGVYNDLLGCAYKVDGQWHVRYWAATCDPGVYYRENPANVAGTAILVPGQYRNVYKINKHRGKYDALCQINGKVTVWRDDNKDDTLDHEDGSEASGYYGINIHASSSDPYNENRDRDADTAQVNRWSAGCQVHATTTGFREMMDLCNKQIKHRGWKTFTYTLVDQWW